MKRSWIILIVVIAISASLLTLAAAKFSFWEDETYTAAQAQKELDQQFQDTSWDVHPILPEITFSIWGSVFGYSELGLRSLSIAASLITLLLTYFLALELFDRRTALVSAGVLSLLPLFLMFGHNARYYPLSAMVSVATVLSLAKYLSKPSFPYLGLYILFSTILIYVSFGAASVILACNIWWLVNWLKNSDRKLTQAGIWIVAHLIILGLYYPGFVHMATVVSEYYGAPQVGNLLIEPAKRLAYLLYTYAVGQTMSPLNPLAWLGCVLTAAIILFGLKTQSKKAPLWVVLLFLLTIITISLLMSFLSPWLSQIWQNMPHWSFHALPFLAILLGTGLANMNQKWALVTGLLLLIVYASAYINYFSGRQYLQTMYAVPWREIFTRIQGTSSPDTGIVCQGSDVACKYYARRFGFDENLVSARQAGDRMYQQVWWVQTNLGTARSETARDTSIREDLALLFPSREIYNYARQDDSIRWLKTTYLGQDDYEYRVEVHRFYMP